MMQVYADTTGNLLQEARTLEEEVKDTEELVSLQLDTQRNKILGVEMVITIFSAFFGLGAFVVGVFGMNFQWSGGMFAEAPRGKTGFGVTVAATGAVVVLGSVGMVGLLRSRFPKLLATIKEAEGR